MPTQGTRRTSGFEERTPRPTMPRGNRYFKFHFIFWASYVITSRVPVLVGLRAASWPGDRVRARCSTLANRCPRPLERATRRTSIRELPFSRANGYALLALRTLPMERPPCLMPQSNAGDRSSVPGGGKAGPHAVLHPIARHGSSLCDGLRGRRLGRSICRTQAHVRPRAMKIGRMTRPAADVSVTQELRQAMTSGTVVSGRWIFGPGEPRRRLAFQHHGRY